MGAEQSNTSLVFDDRIVMKVYRRVHRGTNPDVDVSAGLAAVGFEHVAAPLATWERDGTHLAVAQAFLAGGTDGWAMALTSLRDLYGTECNDPAECGGDFAGEAARLGTVTAQMHLALSVAFGVTDADPAEWSGLMASQLERVGAEQPWGPPVRTRFEAFRGLVDPGVAIRVHGDYHLGQVLRTDTGWFVLDFEGEPARPPAERTLPSSPLKDVAGMLRSLDYASAVALRDRGEAERESLGPITEEWERRNRSAFLDGYLMTDGIRDLLPTVDRDLRVVLAAWELDKAVYEVHYERDHRPDWVDIPLAAINRLIEG